VIPIQTHLDFLVRKQAERDRIGDELGAARQRERQEISRAALAESARDVVNTVLLVTQEQVKSHLEDIVSLALSAVYGDEYAFEFEFGIKRNQLEVTPFIVKGGERFAPKDEVGGGVNDVCSLALRLAMYSLMEPKPAPVFLLDEPGRFLSRDKQPLFGVMLKRISEMLGVQIIMVSHSAGIIDCSDRAYNVTQEGGISRVELIERAE